MRVGLFATCLADAMFPGVLQATTAVIERLGHEVVLPQGQTCCGQMHINTGYAEQARVLIEHHATTFESALQSCDVIVAPSGSCVASVRHQHIAATAQLPALAARVREVAAHTFEFSEFLVDVLGVVDVGAYFPHRVTYHPTCHSLRMLRVGDKPVQLLRAVGGIDLVELPDAQVCCGFGGTFAVKNNEVSTAMLADKMANVLATKAEVCATGDASCLMHIGGGLSRLRVGVRTLYLAEVLACTRDGGHTR